MRRGEDAELERAEMMRSQSFERTCTGEAFASAAGWFEVDEGDSVVRRASKTLCLRRRGCCYLLVVLLALPLSFWRVYYDNCRVGQFSGPWCKRMLDAPVHEVHVIFSNHLDLGFNVRAWCADDPCTSMAPSPSGKPCGPFAYMVLQDYFDNHLPRAIASAAGMARRSNDTFSYMTHSWVLAFFFDCEASGLLDFRPPHEGMPLLRCPNASAIAAMRAAIARREIHFHAFPHSANPGLYDASLLNASLQMARDLAAATGVRMPTTM